jgi:hypothetical protein
MAPPLCVRYRPVACGGAVQQQPSKHVSIEICTLHDIYADAIRHRQLEWEYDGGACSRGRPARRTRRSAASAASSAKRCDCGGQVGDVFRWRQRSIGAAHPPLRYRRFRADRYHLLTAFDDGDPDGGGQLHGERSTGARFRQTSAFETPYGRENGARGQSETIDHLCSMLGYLRSAEVTIRRRARKPPVIDSASAFGKSSGSAASVSSIAASERSDSSPQISSIRGAGIPLLAAVCMKCRGTISLMA